MIIQDQKGGQTRADDQQHAIHDGRQGGFGAGWTSCCAPLSRVRRRRTIDGVAIPFA